MEDTKKVTQDFIEGVEYGYEVFKGAVDSYIRLMELGLIASEIQASDHFVNYLHLLYSQLNDMEDEMYDDMAEEFSNEEAMEEQSNLVEELLRTMGIDYVKVKL